MSSEPQSKKTKVMASSLDQLKAITTIVADTGDFEGK
jgi:transaldolase